MSTSSARLDSQDKFSVFSTLVHQTFICPPPNSGALTIFAVPDSHFEDIPLSDPLFTNADYRADVINAHIVTGKKLSPSELAWQTHETGTKCSSIRGHTVGTSGMTVGFAGSFSVSPVILNSVGFSPNLFSTEDSVVHQLDGMLELQGQAYRGGPSSLSGINVQALLEQHPTGVYCAETGTVIDSCSCCLGHPIPDGRLCAPIGPEITQFEFTVDGVSECSTDITEKLNQINAAWEDALDLQPGDATITVESCEVRSDTGSKKLRTLADRTWFIAQLQGARGRNNLKFRRKVTAAIADPNAPWRQKLLDTFDILGVQTTLKILQDLDKTEVWAFGGTNGATSINGELIGTGATSISGGERLWGLGTAVPLP
eukprot:TRINITY_DN17837_c0_g1_i1.p1 TRINITY_DN17837_c0_g1~~TRINITY_DN17837_c0_g1_i1.p1  ORF type:complete len:402 (+),score=26.83 TRINITY_DN17837_c0_g1_i1:94-1206(+)